MSVTSAAGVTLSVAVDEIDGLGQQFRLDVARWLCLSGSIADLIMQTSASGGRPAVATASKRQKTDAIGRHCRCFWKGRRSSIATNRWPNRLASNGISDLPAILFQMPWRCIHHTCRLLKLPFLLSPFEESSVHFECGSSIKKFDQPASIWNRLRRECYHNNLLKA